jgi:hypothetical protein
MVATITPADRRHEQPEPAGRAAQATAVAVVLAVMMLARRKRQ